MTIAGLEIQFGIRWIRHREYNQMPYDEEVVRLFERGMQQSDIAKKLGINQATVSRRLKKYGKKIDYRSKNAKKIWQKN